MRARLLRELRARQIRAEASRLTPAQRISRLFELVALARSVARPEPAAARPTDESTPELLRLKALLREADARR